MNLNGEHNDVSIMRSRLSNQILASAGLPCSRTSYVKLFINEEYKGLYINVEHIDDEFLQRRFIDDDEGNLYKCFWGADFNYLGNNQQAYADIYELKTNKTENDYTGLISLIEVINNSSDEDFPCDLWEVFDVELYLKTLALEILIGHWDGHAVNKNNFYCIKDPLMASLFLFNMIWTTPSALIGSMLIGQIRTSISGEKMKDPSTKG